MKKYFIYAASALALASCSSNDFVGDNGGNVQGTDNAAINFGGETGRMTRVSSNTAQVYNLQNLQSNGFWVYGIKYSEAEQPTSADDDVVYKNYLLKYEDGTANNTVSNTSGWEYVGVDNSLYRSYVTPCVTEDQTIKYWDYSAAGYTFYAATASPEDVKNGNVVFKKIESATADGATVYDKGYEVTLKNEANIDHLYFADRKPITKPTSYDGDNTPNHGADNVYGGEVNFMFRSGLSKVRVGMYETVPGYSVKIDKFYYTGEDATAATSVGTDGFYADVTNTPLETTADGVKYTVTYYDATDKKLENQPKINPNASGQGSNKQYIKLGDGETNSLKKDVTLSTDVLNPTYDQCTVDNTTKTSGKYTWFLPQTDNNTPLKLKIDYTLTSLDGSQEEIHVKGATATIPSQYLCWKPNCAYTYLFKISTNTNGITGNEDDPAGLYPITFDAAVTLTENGNAEYITSLGEASITTFAYNATDKKYETGGSDYTAGNDIYVTVTDKNGSVVTDINNKTNFYKITEAGVNAGANEAQVAEWIANSKIGYYSKLTNSTETTYFESVTKVPAETQDASEISINAYKLSNLEAGTYAVEYELSDAWTGNYKKIYKVITVKEKKQ